MLPTVTVANAPHVEALRPSGAGSLPATHSLTPVRRAELERFNGATVDDLIGPGLKLLFVGINPGLWTAAVNAHFARPGNRFWPALHRAGITDRLIDASKGMLPADHEHLVERGVGITNIVPTASARADELTKDQLTAGAARLEQTVATYQPVVVAVLGLTAYRQAFGRTAAAAGRQVERLADTELWIAPNPSGLNAHATLDSLAADYAAIASAAGIEPTRA